MKLLSALFVLLLCSVAAFALHVIGMQPAPNSENFTPTDTLQLTFDGPPNNVQIGDIVVQGVNACYPIGTRIIRGNTLVLLPSHYWITGDNISVTVRSPAVSLPFAAQFRVNVPRGSISDWWPVGEIASDGSVPLAITAMDMDNDGPVDLAILYTDALGIARNILYDDPCGVNCFPFSGQVTFISPAPGTSIGPRVLRAADLDGDGLPELVASDFGHNTLVVYRNFSTPGNIQFGDTTQIVLDVTAPRDVQLADMNADGRTDIIVIGQTPDPSHDRIVIYENNGDPNFQYPSQEFSTGSGPNLLDVTDFTVDGKRDLVVSCVDQRALNRFQLIAFNPLSFVVDTLFAGLPSGPDGVIADNFYWDTGNSQRPDLLVWSRGAHLLDEAPYLRRYRNTGSGFAAPDEIDSLPYSPLSVVSADLDAASGTSVSREWIVIGDSSGATSVHYYDPGGVPITINLGTVPQHPLSCLTFDANLDGDQDMFFVDQTSSNSGRILYAQNPDSFFVESDFLDFGTVPNRCTRDSVHYFRNDGSYPATICNVTVPNSAGGVFFLVSPLVYPVTIPPRDSLAITFSYRPCYSLADTGLARINFYGGVGGCHQVGVFLTGTNGMAQITVLPDTIINLGSVERGGTLLGSFEIQNQGNWSMDAFYDASLLNYFSHLGASSEIIVPGGVSPPHVVRFTAPANSPDTMIVELLKVTDSTSCTTCPRQPDRDSRWVYLMAYVVTNFRPQFTFPSVNVSEGDSGTFNVTVHDSNATPPGYKVMCRFDAISPQNGALSILADSTTYSWLWRDSIPLRFQVRDSVRWPIEMFDLTFSAVDTPYNTQVDTVWHLIVHATDDLPQFVLHHDLSVSEGTNIANYVLATVHDEENDTLAGQWHWLGRTPSQAVVSFSNAQQAFSLNWQTTYSDSGSYPLQMIVYEHGNLALSDTEYVMVTVVDRPSNLQAQIDVVPDVVPLGSLVTIGWTALETNLVPMDSAYDVLITQRDGSGNPAVLLSTTYPPLAAGGSAGGSITSLPLDTCGTSYFTLTLTPHSSDWDPNDNSAQRSVSVLCPDLSAHLSSVPDTVERAEPFLIHFQIQEEHGVAVPHSFTATLTDSTTGDVIANRTYPNGIGPHGVIQDTASYVSDQCGAHNVRLVIHPPIYYADDPSNNSAYTVARVWCPDLAALRIIVPSEVHKHVPFPVHFVIGEVNGIDEPAPFTASVYLGGQHQDFPFDGIGPHDTLSGSFQWTADRAGPLPILLKVNPPWGVDQNPFNDTLLTTMNILADPFIAYPLPFTPNGDSYNDTLYFNFGDELFTAPVVRIFTVDGRAVRTLDSISGKEIVWDGRDRDGRDCAPGAYLYTCEDGGRKVGSGIIYVAR